MNKLRKIIKPKDIHHVGSEDIPSEAGSRGCDPATLITSTLWFSGPECLKNEKLPETPFDAVEFSFITISTDKTVEPLC